MSCLALVVGEVAARIILPLLPDPPGTPFVRDKNCTYRLRPSGVGEFPQNHDDHINTMGFRDRDHPRDKPAGRLRVLGLGDSFVYGAVSIRDNFLRIAERKWNDAVGKQMDILLMGVPGWSTENQLGYLVSEGLDLDPDFVVIHFFVENDVTGIPVRTRIIRGNPYPTTSPLPVRNFLRKSHLFVMAESLLWRECHQEERESTGPRSAPADAPVNDIYLHVMEKSLPVYRREPDRRTEALWDEALGYLEKIDAACETAGVPWLLVLIPGEIQVDPEVRAQVLEGLGADPEDFDFDYPQRRLVRWAQENHNAVVDLLPELRREHQTSGRLYAPNDTHWNEHGNAFAGEVMYVVLLNYLLPTGQGD